VPDPFVVLSRLLAYYMDNNLDSESLRWYGCGTLDSCARLPDLKPQQPQSLLRFRRRAARIRVGICSAHPTEAPLLLTSVNTPLIIRPQDG